MSLAAQALLAPYLVGAWINSRAWTRQDPAPVAITDGVSLGRFLPRATTVSPPWSTSRPSCRAGSRDALPRAGRCSTS